MNNSEHIRFYKISEVSAITGIAPHILRYWEKNLSFLKIRRDPAGRRFYSEADIEKIKHIQKMLYEEGYKIKGVKTRFRGEYAEKKKEKTVSSDLLKKLLRMIKEIEKCLP
ncbi:MAG TPA: MerR family transcriptional regulator [bacterium]|nr:MerR family transcriptional regulator [bacterium]